MTDAEKLQVAIQQAKDGLAAGNDPYGAAIYDGDILIAAAHNRVATTGDPIAHAEVETIRAAYGRAAPEVLARSVLYTSCEPCPMCMGTIRWVGIGGVVYASSDVEYGAADSGSPSLAHPATRHLPSSEADQLQRTAKAMWKNRDPRTMRRT